MPVLCCFICLLQNLSSFAARFSRSLSDQGIEHLRNKFLLALGQLVDGFQLLLPFRSRTTLTYSGFLLLTKPEGTLDIRDPGRQQQDVASLSHDVEHANDSISPIFDKEKEQRRLQQVQLIGEIGTQVSDIVRTEGQLKVDKEARAELEARGIEAPGEGASEKDLKAYQDKLVATDAYQRIMGKYGTSGDYQKVTQAVTAALQGLAGGNIGGALAGASAPYLAGVTK